MEAICRACAESANVLVDIFEPIMTTKSGYQVTYCAADLLNEIACRFIVIKTDEDEAPQYICNICIATAKTAVNFKRMIEKTNQKYWDSKEGRKEDEQEMDGEFSEIVELVEPDANNKTVVDDLKDICDMIDMDAFMPCELEEEPMPPKDDSVNKQTDLKMEPTIDLVNSNSSINILELNIDTKTSVVSAEEYNGNNQDPPNIGEIVDILNITTINLGEKPSPPRDKRTRSKRHLHDNKRTTRSSNSKANTIRNTKPTKKVRIMGENSLQCPQCDAVLSTFGNLGIHMRTHTNYRPFKCKYCRKGFTQKVNMITHTRIHTGERPYHCSICSKSFTQMSNLASHKCICEKQKKKKTTKA